MTNYDKLVAKLSELFELEKADLDFGIHRIIKARQKHIRIFLGLEEPPAGDTGAPTLQRIVQREMGELNTAEVERQLESTTASIQSNYGRLAFDDAGQLNDGPAKDSDEGQQWIELREQLDTDTAAANLQLEAEIYSHLTEFFARYYDEADFLSKRRIKAGEAPYAIPYSGEEVMLHWANKDQYYIKSSKDLKDYTFTLPERFEGKRIQFKCERQDPVLNNNNAKREFHLDDEAEIQVGEDFLVIPFHFKIVDKTRTQPETKTWIESIMAELPAEWQQALNHTPEGAKNNLITRHLTNYSRKNESDFFIHKHLGKFLRGELDFYIKNEVMHLDDIDTKSKDYLATRVRLIKALRTIARHIITFLAQLENFQKKLWLKKKYVTETQYCITLDRVFAAANNGDLIAALLEHCETRIQSYDGEMRSQRDEWLKLYRIDELEDYPSDGALTEEFLRAHDKMMLDTVFFPENFKWALLSGIDDLDDSLDGLLIHSENFQALNLMYERYRQKITCVYTDPPYNTEHSKILYKNQFEHSSWNTMIAQTAHLAKSLLAEENSSIGYAIDDYEHINLCGVLSSIYNGYKKFNVIVNHHPQGSGGVLSRTHEYHVIFAKEDAGQFLGAPVGEYTEYRDYKRAGRGENNFRANRKDSFYALLYDPAENKIVGSEEPPEFGSDYPKEATAEGLERIYPIDGNGVERVWRNYHTTGKQHIENGRLVRTERGAVKLVINHEGKRETLFSNWIGPKFNAGSTFGTGRLDALGLGEIFDYPKSLNTTLTAIWAQTYGAEQCVIMDYFAGSGTTADALIMSNRETNADRKYILVEMGDHFDTVLKPRIQKSVYSQEWNNGSPESPKQVIDKLKRDLTECRKELGALLGFDSEDEYQFNQQRLEGKISSLESEISRINGLLTEDERSFGGISHAFKYIRLESYEDALNNLDLGEDRAPDLLGLGDQVRENYLFSYLLDVETRGQLMNLDRFSDPFGCQLKIYDPHSGKSEPRVIDLVETFNYLIGVTVREVKNRDGFLTIEGESPTGDTILILWRKLEGESEWPTTANEALKTFVRETLRLNTADTEYHAIYLNGDHTLEDPQSKIHCIEEVFYERMFENTGNPED